MSYLERLIENCKKAQDADPIREFEICVLDQIKFNLEQFDIRLNDRENCVYIIEEIDGDFEETFRKLAKYRNENRGPHSRKCPKANTPSQIMYVGSSTTNLKNRIRQHMGYGPAGTYALHLRHWFSGKYKIIVKVYCETIEVIQLIEDDLADRLSPAFGKRGGNNR